MAYRVASEARDRVQALEDRMEALEAAYDASVATDDQ